MSGSAELYFEVKGAPATKGSWRTVKRRGKTRMVPQIKREPRWASDVAWCARQEMSGSGIEKFAGPVEVALLFRFVRPKKPKHSYPSRGDIDKLTRSVLDALNGVAWKDDVQVVRIDATKAYWKNAPGVTVRVKKAEGY